MKVAAPPLGGTTKSPRRGSYKPSAEPVVMTFLQHPVAVLSHSVSVRIGRPDIFPGYIDFTYIKIVLAVQAKAMGCQETSLCSAIRTTDLFNEMTLFVKDADS